MKLKINNDDIIPIPELEDNMNLDGTYKNAKGGTELLWKALEKNIDSDLLNQFHIIKSRVRHIDDEKLNILWQHDLPLDPENEHYKERKSIDRFDQLIFVSNWQLQMFNSYLGVPYSKSAVIKNFIKPIPEHEKPDHEERINLIYHTTPHRGLNLLVAAYEYLSDNLWGESVHLDVYSSYKAYGWEEKDESFKEIFDKIKEHKNMSYHGYQPNGIIRKALETAHIFAYPNIWQETSCIAAIEAMSAKCQIICPNWGALPETTGNFAATYQFHENVNTHANIFAELLKTAVSSYKPEDISNKMEIQKLWVDTYHGIEGRINEWQGLLQGMINVRDQEKKINEQANKELEEIAESEEERKVVNGDNINISFSGKVKGKKFKGGTSDSFDLVVGSGSMIPGFEDGIIGMKINEVKNVNVKFPTDYHKENLRDKEASFEIKLLKFIEVLENESTDGGTF